MTDRSAIEWTQATWNPVTGCDRISPGCQHCYALTLARRLKAMGQANYQTDGRPPTSGPGFGVATHPEALGEPLRWRHPRLIFVNSMSDLFHARVPDAFIAQVFAVMAATPRHTYQVLTKRPGRMARLLSAHAFAKQVFDLSAARHGASILIWPMPNLWAGTSVEIQRYADLRQRIVKQRTQATGPASRSELCAASAASCSSVSNCSLSGGAVPISCAYSESHSLAFILNLPRWSPASFAPPTLQRIRLPCGRQC